MMTENVSTWNQLVDLLNEIQAKYSEYKVAESSLFPLILYRGQADSDWSLTTSLERHSKKKWTLRSYFELIYYLAPEIESFNGTSWNLNRLSDWEKKLTEEYDAMLPGIPHYEYWIYLRHNGFPSPLLDWSRSPYVALFFAFSEKIAAKKASLYIYIERPKAIKSGIVGAPMITVNYPYVRTHKRHFLQQAYYTIATRQEQNNNEHTFIAHDNIYSENREDQDILIKIEIDQSVRQEALKKLAEYNINHFSLMQTEESLIKTLATKEFDITA